MNGWTIGHLDKEHIEENLAFGIDYKNWKLNLSVKQRKILNLLIQGHTIRKIAELLHRSYTRVKEMVAELRKAFVNYFNVRVLA